MDLKNFNVLLDSIAEEKGLSKERILEAIEQAIAAAYKKEYGQRGQNIKAVLNLKTGGVDFSLIRLVVTEDMIYSEEELESMKDQPAEEPIEEDEEEKKVRFSEERHIMLEDAKKVKKTIKDKTP